MTGSKLLAELRRAIRVRHYSRRTEEAYGRGGGGGRGLRRHHLRSRLEGYGSFFRWLQGSFSLLVEPVSRLTRARGCRSMPCRGGSYRRRGIALGGPRAVAAAVFWYRRPVREGLLWGKSLGGRYAAELEALAHSAAEDATGSS